MFGYNFVFGIFNDIFDFVCSRISTGVSRYFDAQSTCIQFQRGCKQIYNFQGLAMVEGTHCHSLGSEEALEAGCDGQK